MVTRESEKANISTDGMLLSSMVSEVSNSAGKTSPAFIVTGNFSEFEMI
jgi:hypothetical protein